MTHGSLFSGEGGFDLASEWMGWENVFHCENNEFCQTILKYYWPNAKSYGNIDESDFTIWRGLIDVLSGGPPCQPYSHAGRRKGKEDDRHKWPQMLRAIREIRPGWVVGENVYGIINWSKGLVFEEVQTDLENEGYEVTSYILPACGVNADHRRERIWFVAHSNCNDDKSERANRKHKEEAGKIQVKQKKRERIWSEFKNNGKEWNAANTHFNGQPKSWKRKQQISSTEDIDWKTNISFHDGGRPTVAPVFKRNDGISAGLDIKTISEKDWLESAHTANGNAIVPQVVYQIFKTIEQYEKESK